MKDFEGSMQRDDRSMRKGCIPFQAPSACQAGCQFRAKDPFAKVEEFFFLTHSIDTTLPETQWEPIGRASLAYLSVRDNCTDGFFRVQPIRLIARPIVV